MMQNLKKKIREKKIDFSIMIVYISMHGCLNFGKRDMP